MANFEQFGKYLLLKKLSEDPLGESFRAGRVGSKGLEQVVLLRAFNGPRVDAVRLGAELPQRTAVQQGLKSPTIGNGVDLGEVRGVPFVAYDYISGKTLAAVLGQADRQQTPIPLDHALLIAERIALALSMGYETRLGDQRLLHGFVIPHLVMVSNEGETRLLGFEVGPTLRELAGRGIFEPEISAYLAPETLSGAPPSKADDVYSLGAILFELLTGHRPSADAASLVDEVDRAVVEAEGTPIPGPLAGLIKKSLAPRDQRVPEAASWHKALAKILSEGQYTATTFNLAFFMHNLFRSEIEKEGRELEAELEMPLPAEVPAAAARREAIGTEVPGESSGSLSDTSAVRQHYAAQSAEARSNKGLWIGLGAAILVAAGVGGWYFLQPQTPTEPPVEVTAAPLPEPEPVPPPEEELLPESDEPSPEEVRAQDLEAQLQSMISAQSAEMEAKLKAQYDSQIRDLQRQLEQTQAAAKARDEARRREEEAKAEEAKPEPPEPAREAAAKPADTPASPPAPAASRSGAETAAAGTADAAAGNPAREAAATPSTPPPQPARPTPAAAKPAAGQQQEDVVEIDPPQLLRPPAPRYPDIARRMNKEATVLLRVLVDERGRVVEVERIGSKVGSGIDEAAMDAARQARYRPGKADGKPQAMWTTLRIEFRL